MCFLGRGRSAHAFEYYGIMTSRPPVRSARHVSGTDTDETSRRAVTSLFQQVTRDDACRARERSLEGLPSNFIISILTLTILVVMECR